MSVVCQIRKMALIIGLALLPLGSAASVRPAHLARYRGLHSLSRMAIPFATPSQPRTDLGPSSRWLRRPLPPPRVGVQLAIRDQAEAVPVEGDVGATYQAALVQTALIVFAACCFGMGIWFVRGQELAFQYFAGYVIEESLSVDNLFVFKLIFDFFTVRGVAQKKCLNWGIWAAAAFRLIMISLGVEAVAAFRPVLLFFAAILILSSGTILAESFGEEKEPPDLADNAVVKFCSSIFPTTEKMDGDKFWSMAEDGVKKATPLLVALACIEVSDIVFAVDSVPAVLGVTSDTFIAFTSNMFAILGLRALYTVLSTLVSDFEYLQVCCAALGLARHSGVCSARIARAARAERSVRRARGHSRSAWRLCLPALRLAPLLSLSRRSPWSSALWGARWWATSSATRSRLAARLP